MARTTLRLYEIIRGKVDKLQHQYSFLSRERYITHSFSHNASRSLESLNHARTCPHNLFVSFVKHHFGSSAATWSHTDVRNMQYIQL